MHKHTITTIRDLLETKGRTEQRIRQLERKLSNSLDGQALLELFHVAKRNNQMVILTFPNPKWVGSRRKVVVRASERMPEREVWTAMYTGSRGEEEVHTASLESREDGEFFFWLGPASSDNDVRHSFARRAGVWWNIKELHYLKGSATVEDMPK